MTNIGREIIWAGKKGIITGEKTGRGGKVLFSVKMNDALEVVLFRLSFDFPAEFAAPNFHTSARRDEMLKRAGGDATLLRR